MSGYLQRLAVSVLKPGGNIRPLQGSVFAPTEAAAGPRAGAELETRPPVAAAGSGLKPESTDSRQANPPAGHRQPDSDGGVGGTAFRRTIASEEPGESRTQPVESLVPPIPPERAVSADPVGRTDLKSLMESREGQLATTRNQGSEATLEETSDRQGFTKSAIALSNLPMPPTGDRPQRAASRAEPAEIQNRMATGFPVPLMALPQASTTIARSEGRPVTQSSENPMAEPVGSVRPLVPIKTGDSAGPDWQARPIAPAKVLPENQGSQGWPVDTGIVASAATVEVPTGASGGAEVDEPKTKASLVPIMQKDFRSLAPGPVVAVPDGREKPGSRRPESSRREPDDIQIQIGRIEVVAAPPRRPVAPKPPRVASSLGEYLRRRDGKAV